jgi:N-acetylmuramoyl-L-alanine amidase
MGMLTPAHTRALGWAAGLLLLFFGSAMAAPHLEGGEAPPAPTASLKTAPTAAPRAAPVAVAPAVRQAVAQAAVPATVGGAVMTLRTVNVRVAANASAKTLGTIGPGAFVPVTSKGSRWYKVVTHCERRGWIDARAVTYLPPAVKRARTLRGATIVVDPGHGGGLRGAVGPTGLTEKAVNLDVARRLTTLLQREGARVVLTRTQDDTAGLGFRSLLADALAADMLVSIHHNAVPTFKSSVPGTEVYGQSKSSRSMRLTRLTYSQIFSALRKYKVQWVADPNAGPKIRLNAHGDDYYALLRRTNVPAIIVESLFISNGAEEGLLRKANVRQVEAQALLHGLQRYMPTVAPGHSREAPYPRGLGGHSGLPSRCVDPR